MAGEELRAALDTVNRASPFNQMAGMEILRADPGGVALALAASAPMLNHAGALHAGVQSGLIDTACGYAAGTLAGNVVTVQLSLNFLSAARGERFIARAEVTRAGKTQVFAEARLFAQRGEDEVLVATGTAVLARIVG